MIRRDWILETLSRLAVWYWPVFFWNLARLKAYIAARKAEGGAGMVGYIVTRTGRIHITLDARGDRPDPNDWTRHAPRAPWERLDPEASHAALMACCGTARGGLLPAAPDNALMLSEVETWGRPHGGRGLPHILAPP